MASTRVIDISRLESLPVDVTVRMGRSVQAIAGSIRSGEAPVRPVVVASARGRMYPVDGLDVLEAHRAAGSAEVPCIVVEAADEAEAVGLHVAMSGRRPVNPFMVVDAIRWMERSGRAARGVDPRYAQLSELPLAGDVRETFEKWIGRLADRLEVMPQFWHIFRPLSAVRPEDQSRALESVMAFVHAMGTSPDISTLRGILRQFAVERPEAAPRVTATGEDCGKAATPTPAAEPERSRAAPVENSRRISCGCCRQWYVDTKRGTIRRVREADNMTVLTGDDGEPVYAVPPEVAEHLQMDRSSVHHYLVAGPFPAVVVSARGLDGKVVEMVAEALERAGRPEGTRPAATTPGRRPASRRRRPSGTGPSGQYRGPPAPPS